MAFLISHTQIIAAFSTRAQQIDLMQGMHHLLEQICANDRWTDRETGGRMVLDVLSTSLMLCVCQVFI